jgi:hypothetical protein
MSGVGFEPTFVISDRDFNDVTLIYATAFSI